MFRPYGIIEFGLNRITQQNACVLTSRMHVLHVRWRTTD